MVKNLISSLKRHSNFSKAPIQRHLTLEKPILNMIMPILNTQLYKIGIVAMKMVLVEYIILLQNVDYVSEKIPTFHGHR